MNMKSILLGLLLAPSFAFSLSFGVLSDAGKDNKNTRLVRESMMKTSVREMVMAGDNVYLPHESYSEPWGPWKVAGFVFEVVAIGNHNLGYEKEISYFQLPGEFYSKTYDNEVRFIVLNSDNQSSGLQQAEWLDQELRAANEPFVFLVYHHPTYTLTREHSWREKEAFQKAVRPVIWKNRERLTSLIVGHDHLAEMVHFNDLPVIVSGAAWEMRSDLQPDNKQSGVSVVTEWTFDRTPHWARLDTDLQSGVATVHFIKAKGNKEVCTVRIVTGKKGVLAPNCSR